MPLSDSSQTCTRAVRPKPSPAVLRLRFAAGISEVSRFSCMKFLGVPGAFDYAGPNKGSRYRPCPCCLPHMLTDRKWEVSIIFHEGSKERDGVISA